MSRVSSLSSFHGLRPSSKSAKLFAIAGSTLRNTASWMVHLRTALLFVAAVASPLAANAANAPQTVTKFSLAQGVANSTQSVAVPITTGGTLTKVSVVTQGVTGLDFTDAQNGDGCVVNTSYTNTTCSVNVQFQPKAPGQHFGAVVLTFGSGTSATYAVQYLYGSSLGPLGVIIPGLINTVAGTSNFLFSGDGVAATSAPIQLPLAEVVDAQGNLYISDSGNNRIRKVDTSEPRIITTYAGNGNAGSNGDGLLATLASITSPSGLAIDGVGNLYFADRSTNEIRMVDANTHLISIVAGIPGAPGYIDGPALQAELTQPNGLAIDADQNLYIADTGNNVIRMIDLKVVDPSARQIVTIAGTQTPSFGGDGSKASLAIFNQPWGIAFGPDGYLYIADVNNNAIRKIDPSGVGATATVVGSPSQPGNFGGDAGPANLATLQNPEGVAVDLAGNIYIADTQNNRIRKATKQPNDKYVMSTIAGNDNQTFDGDGGNSDGATMSAPSSLALDSAGNLYFGDLFHNRVRVISSNLSFPPNFGQIKNFRISTAKIETFENDGNAIMTLKPITFDNSALDNASTCPTSATLGPAISCTLDVEFAPQVQNLPDGGAQTAGTITIPSDAANSSATINLTGDVLAVNPTTTAIVSSGSPSAVGAAVTFTVTVTNGNNGAVTGTITFLDGTTTIGTGTINDAGVASFSTSTLVLGKHFITASYGGDTNNAPSVSTPALTQIVQYGTTLVVVSSLRNGSTYPQSVTFTATLSGALTPVGGTISFADGGTSLGTFATSPNGVATLTIKTLAPGQHTIVATFSSDTNNLGSSGSVGQSIAFTPTSTALSVDNATITYGAAVALQATVSSTGNPPAPDPLAGSVTFMDGTTVLNTVPLSSGGIASLTVSGLAPGIHSIAAIYSGDTDNATSKTATALTETVNKISTSTVVSSSANPANAGATITLTASVSPAGNNTAGGQLSGTVTFFDGSTQIGLPQALATNAKATISTSFGPGTGVNFHNITAVYSGAANYAGSTSPDFPQSVTQNTTTTALSSGTNPSIAGKTFELTAIVSGPPGTPAPTGTVKFTSGGTILGQVSLNSSGQAILPTSALVPGLNQVITATYSGDTNNSTSNATVNQTVTIAQTQLTLSTSAPNAAKVGDSVIFTATLIGSGGQPSGTVTFFNGGAQLGQVTLTGSGLVTFATSSLPVGPNSITASYGGDTNDDRTTSSTVTQQIQKVPTSTALISSSNPGMYNQPITFTATITSENIAPTGVISFQDGANPIGSASIIANGSTASGTASLTLSNLSLGNHSIVAIYVGDPNHAQSQSSTLSQQVLQAASVVVTSSNPSSVAGTNVTLTANVAGVQNLVPSGNVTFKDGPSILGVTSISPAVGTSSSTGVATFSTSSFTPGAHSIVASYSGDANYQPSGSPVLTQNVIVANTSVSLTSSANPATFGTSLTFTANITGTGGGVTGTVTFMDGASVVGKVAVNNLGVASLTTTALAAGQHTITAVYGGDTDNQPNTSSALQQQVQQTTLTTIVSNANPALTLDPIVLTCAVNNGGAQHATGVVTFTDGSTLLGAVTLDGNGLAVIALPALAAGQHNVVASYSGDVSNFPSASAPFPQVVQLRPTTDVLTATTTSLTDGKQLTLISVVRWSGSVTPTGTVNFKMGNTVIGTATLDSVGVATLTIVLDPGAATTVASYSGDSIYAASDSPATAISDGPPTSFTLQLSGSNISLQSKQNMTVDLNIVSLNGFTDDLKLGCLGLPFAASCTFSTDQATLQPNTTLTLHVVVDTSAPLLAGTTASVKTSGFARTSKASTIWIFVCSILCGLLLMRSRKRHPLTGLLILLCSIAVVAGISGCGTLNINGTPAGTYTFKITASGMKTGITQSTNMTLTVKQ